MCNKEQLALDSKNWNHALSSLQITGSCSDNSDLHTKPKPNKPLKTKTTKPIKQSNKPTNE